MTCGIYQFRNKVTDWKYVGSSVHVEKRFKGHLKGLRAGRHHCKHLLRAWNKYGEEAFVFSILEECEPEKLLEREQSYLPEERTWEALKANKFYNQCPVAGNPLGVRHSEESKRKMSESKIGKPSPFKGIKVGPMSEEARRKISAGLKGKNKTEEHNRRVSEGLKGNQNSLGHKFSEESKRKLSEAQKGRVIPENTRRAVSEANRGNTYNLGKKRSEESKQKMAEAKRGKKSSEESIQKKRFTWMRKRVERYIEQFERLRAMGWAVIDTSHD